MVQKTRNTPQRLTMHSRQQLEQRRSTVGESEKLVSEPLYIDLMVEAVANGVEDELID